MTAPDRQTWKASAALQVFWVLIGVMFAVLGLGTLVGFVHDSSGWSPVASRVGGSIGLVFGFVAPWVVAIRPAVHLDTRTLTVVNPWRTISMPLDRVRAVTSGYNCMVLEYFDGTRMRTVSAWAVQKWNIAVWMKRRTRADGIADIIRSAIDREPGQPSGPVPR